MIGHRLDSNPTRALITGINGFTGIHLARHLLARGNQVFGLDRSTAKPPPDLKGQVQTLEGDVRNRSRLKQILTEIRPDHIYHLAAIIKTNDIENMYQINVLGTVDLLQAIVETNCCPKVLVTSSSAVYGKKSGARPLTERIRPLPVTHYGVSKVAQETVAFHYHLAYGLPVFCSRAFNLIGPGQSSDLACSAFARQIALLEKDLGTGKLYHGNLQSQRDLTDIRDAVRAYRLIVELGKPGTLYNVCTEKVVSLATCLDVLLSMARVSVEPVFDSHRLWANDVPIQVGSAALVYAHTGWQAQIPLEQSLADLLNDWRGK